MAWAGEIRVLRAGVLDTVQDLGRPGYASQGVPASGAADGLALTLANRLAGNADDAAALEMTQAGPLLEFSHRACVALTGARFEARRSSGAEVVWRATMFIEPGERLDIGRAPAGLRCWLAVRGGLDVPACLGSRSTLLPSRLGGLEGRRLGVGDVLRVGPAPMSPRMRVATGGDDDP
jgi:allophanate hydrolase subunit 2